MNLLHHLCVSSIGTALDELLCVGIANTMLDFERLTVGLVEIEEVGFVRRDSHRRNKMDKWGIATGREQVKPKDNETELFHDEPSGGERNILLRCDSRSLKYRGNVAVC